jgi:DNA-binding NarL/FixJ family response regulator
VTRVLIADDDDLMRAGLAELLTADPAIERRIDGRPHARPRRDRRHP